MNYKIEYNGRNFINFLDYLNRNKISISNVTTIDEKTKQFELLASEYKRLKKINKVFKLRVVSSGGVKRLISFIISRIGIIIGIVSILLFSIFSSKIAVDIRVVGNKNISSETIKTTIKKYGYKFGKTTKFDSEKLEKYLLENVPELSLVSIAKQGNVLVVNVVEYENKANESMPFYSPYNMVIKDVKAISGTLCVKKNDIVKKGDLLVDNYVINSNGERVMVDANAEIIGEVYFCGSETVNKKLISYEKTGKKITKKSLSFNISKKPQIDNNYKYFDTKYISKCISYNIFMPIYVNIVTVYELQQVENNFDYENNKDIYFEKSLKNAYTLVPNNVTINETIQNVTECEDKYIFQTYLKSEVRLTNEN